MNERAEMIHYGPWQIAVKVTHALCQDGKRRNVRITGQPDTFFTIPGSVKVSGKTVTGFVTHVDEDYQFHANNFGKNGHLLH